MQVPAAASFEQAGSGEVSAPIHCARVAKKHDHELLRHLVLAVAFVAVVLLIAIALYYTQGNSVYLHSILAAPQGKLRA